MTKKGKLLERETGVVGCGANMPAAGDSIIDYLIHGQEEKYYFTTFLCYCEQ